MTLIYVIVSIKLRQQVANDECFVLCNLGGRSISGFEVIEGGLWSLLPVAKSEKKPRAEWG